MNEHLRAARGPVALRIELKLRADRTQLTQRQIVRAFENRLIAKRLPRTCVFAAFRNIENRSDLAIPYLEERRETLSARGKTRGKEDFKLSERKTQICHARARARE